ncbi:MAG: asparaginase domain-containing protein [Nannocystaceae bacterium]
MRGDRPRVCLLHVGGTIGMTKTPDGLRPVPGVLERFLAGMPELTGPDVPLLHVERLDPLLDSADMGPHDWVRIARAIIERDHEFDGFVVLHGTDTMVYTASALSFLLPGLRKPVVLTGSQLSLEHVRSDGREHIITSLIIAGRLRIPEVCIYFACACCGATARRRSTTAISSRSAAVTCRRWRPWAWASASTSTCCAHPVQVCPTAWSWYASPTSRPCACFPASAARCSRACWRHRSRAWCSRPTARARSPPAVATATRI